MFVLVVQYESQEANTDIEVLSKLKGAAGIIQLAQSIKADGMVFEVLEFYQQRPFEDLLNLKIQQYNNKEQGMLHIFYQILTGV